MEIDRFGDRPAYVQIADWLREQITSGTYGPDDRLPSKKELRQQLGIGSETFDKAMRILRDEGLVRTARGLGHYPVPRDQWPAG
jgi:GntR family transcriptional regulator